MLVLSHTATSAGAAPIRWANAAPSLRGCSSQSSSFQLRRRATRQPCSSTAATRAGASAGIGPIELASKYRVSGAPGAKRWRRARDAVASASSRTQ